MDNHNKVSIGIGFAGDGVYSHRYAMLRTTLALCGDTDEFFMQLIEPHAIKVGLMGAK